MLSLMTCPRSSQLSSLSLHACWWCIVSEQGPRGRVCLFQRFSTCLCAGCGQGGVDRQASVHRVPLQPELQSYLLILYLSLHATIPCAHAAGRVCARAGRHACTFNLATAPGKGCRVHSSAHPFPHAHHLELMWTKSWVVMHACLTRPGMRACWLCLAVCMLPGYCKWELDCLFGTIKSMCFCRAHSPNQLCSGLFCT